MNVLVPLADGFEEIECVSVVDILRRCGVAVRLAGINGVRAYKGAHDMSLMAECDLHEFSDVSDIDAIALPGGWQGMENLSSSMRLEELLRLCFLQKKLLSAICAAPIVLARANVLQGDFTCYPSCEEHIHATNARYIDAHVVKSHQQITASGPASAPWFALEIASTLGANIANITQELLLPTLEARIIRIES